MSLPNPGMDAVPFTPLTAEFLDDMIENIESLSDGTGFENGAITTNTLADNGVTSLKLGIVTYSTPVAETFAVTTANKPVFTATNTCYVNAYIDYTASASASVWSINGGERCYVDPQRSRSTVGFWLKPGDILNIKGGANYTAGWLRLDVVSFA